LRLDNDSPLRHRNVEIDLGDIGAMQDHVRAIQPTEPLQGPDNPVLIEIIRGAIGAAQSEMEALIERTAISAFIREKKDFYTALFDRDGVMAVGSMIPIFGDMTGPVLDRFPASLMKPGDVYWYNDCYGSRGAVSHSNDQVLIAPVFREGHRVAFVMAWAHFADIGGLRPGSISPDATDIMHEGIVVPPTKLIDAGVTNEAALAIFHRNSRYPQQSIGDMKALMASVELGMSRVGEIVARFGKQAFQDALEKLLDRTRRLVRRRLAETFAYGTHRFTDAIDSDGHGSGPFKLRFALTRAKGDTGEDRFIFDATETDDQAFGPVNFLMNPGVPGMALGLYYLGGDPAQVCNAGGPQALDEVRLREGSLLWPRWPAAHSAYVITIMRGRYRDAQGQLQPFLLADGIGVGYGARPTADGIDAVYFVAQENYPVEFLELGYPVRLRAYGVVRDSGGPGRHRGGCGILREYEILAEDALFGIRIDSVKNPPWGIAGGMSGGPGRVVVNPGAPDERQLPPLSDGHKLKHGDILRIETGGGGGHGHPFDRPVESVLEDVLGGYVGPEAARRHYGVSIVDDEVDADATAALRRMRPAVKAFHRMDYVDVLS
jgi:N-methylhydantoinase B